MFYDSLLQPMQITNFLDIYFKPASAHLSTELHEYARLILFLWNPNAAKWKGIIYGFNK